MSYVTITTADGKSMKAFEALAQDKSAPGLILIQEIFGVNSSMRQLAKNWADQGFNVWCPDLFFRSEPGLELDPTNQSQFQLGVELMQEMDVDASLADLESAREQLAQKLGHDHIVSVGYCMGGRLVVLFANQSPIKAAVSYYGVGLDKILPNINAQAAPTLFHIAELDASVPAETRAVIEADVAQRSGWESYVYADCDHAFARPNGMHYQAEADALALERSLGFLKKNL